MGIAVMAVPVFMHSPMQKMYAVKAAHGARGAGERFPLLGLHTGTKRKNAGKEKRLYHLVRKVFFLYNENIGE